MEFKDTYFYDEVREGYYVPGLMKKCWAAQLEVLNDIDKVCRENDLEYFAEWGTLLGAVRHGGFIPWDDDLDICMKRESYDRFLEIIEREWKDKYIIANFHTEDERSDFLTRIANINHFRFDDEFLEKYHEFPFAAGIDVFPMDYAPPKGKEKEYLDLMKYIITVAEGENNPKITKEQLNAAIRNIEKDYKVRINRNKPIKSQIYQVADKLCGKFKYEETDDITLMPVWLMDNNYKIPKDLYRKAIRIPFENTTIPVPVGYDEILRRKYGNYMKPVRSWDSHEYPYYKKQEIQLKNNYDIEFSKYHFKKIDLERMLPESLKAQLMEFLPLVEEAHEELRLRNGLLHSEESEVEVDEVLNDVAIILGDCQEGAIAMGNLIEGVLGEGTGTVSLLEEYCELVYEAGESFSTESIAKMDNQLQQVIESVEKNIPKDAGTFLNLIKDVVEEEKNKRDKKLIFFIVSKVSEWKYIENIYNQCISEGDDAYVMPVPYYDKSFTGKLTKEHYEGELFDKSLQFMSYEMYDLQAGHPDIIYTQNAFDEANFTCSIAPNYYSSRIKNYTDRLIYVPPFETEEINEADDRCIGIMEEYAVVPGVIHADTVYAQSDNIRRRYIERLINAAGKDTADIWEEKIQVNPWLKNSKGSSEKNEKDYPLEWNAILKDAEDKYKKVLLYVVSAGFVASNSKKAIKKIRRTIEMLNTCSDDIAVIWRLDKAIPEALKDDEENVLEEYHQLINEVKHNGKIVVDETEEMDAVIGLADAFYGDGCVEATKCRVLGKPVMLQNIDV